MVEGDLSGELQKLLPRQEALSKLMDLTRASAALGKVFSLAIEARARAGQPRVVRLRPPAVHLEASLAEALAP